MTTYTLTVSTGDLGLGVISGARVVVERKRTQVTDIFNGRSIGTNSTATNSSGIATALLEPDDGSVYHELKIFDLAGIPVYSKIFTMPPQAVALTALPVQDIITASAAQAVAASVTATAQAVIATNKAVLTAEDRTQTGQDVIATAADAVATAADAVATAADAVATALDVIATESARDAALIQAGVYTTEALGRAAVADGQAFKVQGSGDVAAYEYRRTDASTSVLIATYPSAAYVESRADAEVGKNLFNPIAPGVLDDYYISNTTGLPVASVGFTASDYIKIAASTSYRVSSGRQMAWYTANKVFISGVASAGGVATTVTSPANAYCLRASVADAALSIFQIELGTVSTAYEPYIKKAVLADNQVTTSKLAGSAVTASKLADASVTASKTDFLQIGKNKFNKNAVTNDFYITNTGSIFASAFYDLSDYIPVVVGTQYVCGGSGIYFSCYFDKNLNVVAGGTGTNITTFTPPSGVAYVRVSTAGSNLDTFQLEVGATTTAFESYRYNLLDHSNVPIALTLTDGQVTEAKLVDLAVTTNKVAVAAITPDRTNFLQLGKNKFNKATVTTGYYITNTGAILANATYDISDYIPVVVGTAYICNGSGIRFSCYFDANKSVVSGGTGTNIFTFTPPVGAVYVKLTMYHSDLALFQLEVGATTTAFESYRYNLLDHSNVPIALTLTDGQVTEAKLVDLAVTTNKVAVAAITPDRTNFLQLGKNKFNKATVTTGYYITNTGAILANATYDISDYIPVVVGTAYICNGSGIRFSCYFDANHAVVAGGTGTGTNIFTFTPPVGAVYVKLTMYHSDLALFQLEIGPTATAYADYQYVISLSSGIPISLSDASATPVLVMPPTIYAVQNRECNIYLDNLHLGDSELFAHDVVASYGSQQRERFTLTPTGAITSTIAVSAYNKTSGKVLASVSAALKSVASTAGSGTTKVINTIGDSLINAATITQTVIDIAATDVMGVSFIGTKGTAPNKHEGRGGWSINDYSTVGRTFYSFTVSGVVTSPLINSTEYTNNGSTFKVQEIAISAGSGTIICERTVGTNAPSASGTLTKSSGTGDATISFSASSTVSGNPFWISGALNYSQYLTNNSLATPDWVVIHLGINDAFSYTTDATVVAAAIAAFVNLDLLITSIKAAGAGVKVALMIPTPPANQDGFGYGYGTGQTAWRDKRNIMLWAKELITKYTGQEASRIYLVPTNTALDVVNGYPLSASAPVNSRSSVTVQRQNNGVHPDTSGYQQIGDCLWAFLKCNA
jgi:lysophospholipase L1-like esterase/transcriptional antiterminator Rof (Rho-off)